MCDANFYYNQQLQDCSPCPDNLTVCQEFLKQVIRNECSRSCQRDFSTTPLTGLTATPSPGDLINKPAESFESCSALLCKVVPIAACCILALLITAIVYWKRKKLQVCIERRRGINSHSDDGEKRAIMTAPQRAVNNQPVVTMNPGDADSQCIRANMTKSMPTSDHSHAKKEIIVKANWNGVETYLMVKANGYSCAKTPPTLPANKDSSDEPGTQPIFKDHNESSIQDDEEHRSYCYTHKGNPICKDNSHVPVDLEKGVEEEGSKMPQSHS